MSCGGERFGGTGELPELFGAGDPGRIGGGRFGATASTYSIGGVTYGVIGTESELQDIGRMGVGRFGKTISKYSIGGVCFGVIGTGFELSDIVWKCFFMNEYQRFKTY